MHDRLTAACCNAFQLDRRQPCKTASSPDLSQRWPPTCAEGGAHARVCQRQQQPLLRQQLHHFGAPPQVKGRPLLLQVGRRIYVRLTLQHAASYGVRSKGEAALWQIPAPLRLKRRSGGHLVAQYAPPTISCGCRKKELQGLLRPASRCSSWRGRLEGEDGRLRAAATSEEWGAVPA